LDPPTIARDGFVNLAPAIFSARVDQHHEATIENNGVGIGASSGGRVFSYGDNSFADKIGGDGVAPTPIGLK
jgi:hypothetical protein